ncbi:MAG: class I SAM-dependent methyltransferase [Dehalococcoidia bacterium]|nr:class I SAM-dependent methyltransferase [Dehalococcoidia bacterium]
MTAIPSNWYTEFFDEDYPKIYSERLSQDATERESAFAVRALGLQEGDRVLDLACGHGRHAVALARRGMVVTGQDLNEDYLQMAQVDARRSGVEIETVHSDMRDIPFTDEFDAVINMFTAFGYFDSEDEDFRVLQAVANALKDGGKLLLDTLNREWVLSNYVQNDWHTDDDGNTFLEHREFDLVSGRNRVTFSIVTADGARRESPGHDVRLYTLTELVRLLDAAGLRLSGRYGDYDGAPYAINTPRMVVIATKD